MSPISFFRPLLAGLLLLAGGVSAVELPDGDNADIKNLDWQRFGGNYSETHYSPLSQINVETVDRLGLEWSFDLPVGLSSGASSPVEANGVLYFAAGFDVIHAVEATTGKLLWKYDTEAGLSDFYKMRVTWGVRGIAYGNGKVFTGTADGRLIAIDAETGKQVWSVQTTEGNDGRYITGFPYVLDGLVVIGHGGADFAPVRGYVTAYDVDTGARAWRFYTVPGNPADGFESPAMAMAAKTWTGEWWKFGGGGTVWNAMAYDKELNRVYLGTGNGAPWNPKIRSPEGGDNLFVCSIVALDATTGEYVWHYQINPREAWDYNAAMDIQLGELTIDGERRKVLLQAPKNGFFYVIDRTDGSLISAEKFARANWASHIDINTGRPVENPAARYPDGTAFLLYPSSLGAHGVSSMSWNPQTGLVYLPAKNIGGVYRDPPDVKGWQPSQKSQLGNGVDLFPGDVVVPPGEGWLAAWDPRDQKEVWRVPLEHTMNGGTLTTGGDLVMQGRATGELSIYNASSGEKLWSFDAKTGIRGNPITYSINGKQYISILVGWRELGWNGKSPRWDYRSQERRLLTFALDGQQTLPGKKVAPPPIVEASDFAVDNNKADQGQILFNKQCGLCHGPNLIAAGAGPDLLRSQIAASFDALSQVVQKGALRRQGMPPFAEMPDDELEAIQHFIRRTARDTLAVEN